jgi:hypothetical protein
MEKKSIFTKVSRTENRLYGPRKLLICGFPLAERSGFLDIMKLAEIEDVPTVWAESEQADDIIKRFICIDRICPDLNSESKLVPGCDYGRDHSKRTSPTHGNLQQ